MKIVALVKFAKNKKDYLTGIKEEHEEDATGLSREMKRKLGIGNDDDEDDEMSAENRFAKMFSAENMEYYYKPYGFDTLDIREFYPLDEEHTMVLSEIGGAFPIKIGWKEWLKTWEERTGEAIFLVGEAAKNNQK